MSAGLGTVTISVGWLFTLLAQAPGRPALERLEQQVQAAASPGVQPGYLGLVADDRQDQGRGIRIVELIPSGPAAQAGLEVGDVVVSINGQPMRTMADMERVMLVSPAGTELMLEVQRGVEQRQLRVTLGQRQAGSAYGRVPGQLPEPSESRAPALRAYLGVVATEINGEILRQAGLPAATRGAAVQSLMAGSPAEKANIPPGAVIVGANGEAVNSPADLLNLVARSAPGDSLELSFYDRGQLVRRKVILEPPRTETTLPPGDVKPAPVEPPNAIPAPRIEVLERRIEQLEQRVRELERALRRPAPQGPART
jgi:S1-C subfamily serine protease